jgi:hypothetical protein
MIHSLQNQKRTIFLHQGNLDFNAEETNHSIQFNFIFSYFVLSALTNLEYKIVRTILYLELV